MGLDPRLRKYRTVTHASPRRISVIDRGSVAIVVIDSRPALPRLSWILISPEDSPWAHGEARSKRECVRRAMAAYDRINDADAIDAEHRTTLGEAGEAGEAAFKWDDPAGSWIVTHYRGVGSSPSWTDR